MCLIVVGVWSGDVEEGWWIEGGGSGLVETRGGGCRGCGAGGLRIC